MPYVHKVTLEIQSNSPIPPSLSDIGTFGNEKILQVETRGATPGLFAILRKNVPWHWGEIGGSEVRMKNSDQIVFASKESATAAINKAISRLESVQSTDMDIERLHLLKVIK